MIVVAALSLLIWLYLLVAHGRFWQSGPVLPPARPAAFPSIAAVVPARDEAEGIVAALRSLLAQDYPGPLRVVLVDDESTDGTGDRARGLDDARLTVIEGAKRPPGWSGKLWAVAQGVAEAAEGGADRILLTDADIVHESGHLAALVAKATQDRLDLVSEMVALRCETPAERALVPAFVYFFQLLYPFARINDPLRATAGAAGGTILVRRAALERIGGIAAIRGELIDDVALGAAVKRGGPIWLGHTELARSVRAYPRFSDIWRMVARTAYVQLGYSPVLLVLCILGLLLTFAVPPIATLAGHGAPRWMGLAAWIGMAVSYVPTLRRYRRSVLWAPFLPVIALFYAAATIGAASDHHFGRGVVWKSRSYQGIA